MFANFPTIISATCAESEAFESGPSLVSAFVVSRLDHCNSLLHSVAVRDILKLQRVQNCLARVVTRAGRFAPSTPPFVTLSTG